MCVAYRVMQKSFCQVRENRTLYQRFDNTFFNMLDLHHRILSILAWKQDSFAQYNYNHIKRLAEHTTMDRLRESYNTVSLSHTI